MPVLTRLVNVNPAYRYVPKIYQLEDRIPPEKKRDIRDFLKAVKENDVLTAESLLSGGLDVDVEGEQKETALTTAVFKGNESMCELLIKHGCDVNKSGTVPPFYFRLTPLCQAVSLGRTEIVHLLLQSGCQKDLRDDLGRSAVFYSVSASNMDMLDLLLRAECDVNLGTKDTNCTLLHEAVAKGKLDIVKMLPKAGADPNRYEKNHLTPAFFTTRRDIHEELVKYGSNINHASRTGDTVLHHAITHGDLPLVEFFLERGAIVNATQTKCVYSSRNLLQQVSQQDPLLQAAIEHYFNICARLLQHGCSTDFVNFEDTDLLTRILNSENVTLILVLVFARGNTTWLKRILNDGILNHLSYSKDLRSWLWSLTSQPLSLKMLAAHTIRKELKVKAGNLSILRVAQKLSVPKRLLDFIMIRVNQD